jgi:hypothetical protein
LGDNSDLQIIKYVNPDNNFDQLNDSIDNTINDSNDVLDNSNIFDDLIDNSINDVLDNSDIFENGYFNYYNNDYKFRDEHGNIQNRKDDYIFMNVNQNKYFRNDAKYSY